MNTAKTEAVANANAHLNNAGMSTYSDLLTALQAIVDEAGPNYGMDDGPGCVNRMARLARLAIARSAA